ncbi:hypothetical protein ACHQM5_008733 [Ranunculus cassubicifolius]
MDKRGIKSSKKERVKLRKKLLENGTSIIPSESNLTDENSVKERRETKKNKLSGKKRKEQSLDASDVDHMVSLSDDTPKKLKHQTPIEEKEENKKMKVSKKKREKQKASGDVDKSGQLGAAEEDGSKILEHKSERAGKKKKKGVVSSEEVSKLSKKESEFVADEVYHISSVNEDSSKGMKKWIHEYHQSRPGLKILQERIDDFIITHELKLEQERKEREERIAEGGWTVVKHEKGRKKTTDADTGTAVGGVAQAAVLDKMGKKKIKDVGVDFYRFQKREAQRNEIMLLQSKFEEDKKRIQQLRAARKFRPY